MEVLSCSPYPSFPTPHRCIPLLLPPAPPPQAQQLRMEAASYLQYVRLREQALGPLPPACPTDLEVPAFPSLAETQVCVNKCGGVLGPLPPACPTDLEVPAFPSLAETQVCVNKCGVVRCGDIHARAQSCTNIAVNIV